MANTPRLSSLRQPPVVGEFYLVPVVDFIWCGRSGVWPTLGPLHRDPEHFKFHHLHYHIDARFLTKAQADFAMRQVPDWYSERVEAAVGARPLHRVDMTHAKGMPRLARRKCRSAGGSYQHGLQKAVQGLRGDYSDPALPIRKADGRLLCPHRKVDLSSFVPDVDGVVTCPLHGLRVQCRGHGETGSEGAHG